MNMNLFGVKKFVFAIFLAVILLALFLIFKNKNSASILDAKASPLGIISQIDYPAIEYKESQVCIETTYNKDVGDIQDNIGYQNNKFGLYIYAEEDFVEIAGDLVNSNGGDWGYVLIPINVKDYDGAKWRKIFRLLNSKHLIPIIQLWDLSKEDEEGQLKESAAFLDSLDWPIEKRYISVFNEPNDSRFWREKANPEEYAEVLDKTISIFKNQNPDFFMLNGAFNSSARTGGGYIDEETFLVRMDKAFPGIFERLDGWASHPYPQPNYKGSPYNLGRESVKAYDWELNLLNTLFGVKDLPIFITETGWAHANGQPYNIDYLSKEIVARYFVEAYTDVWLSDEKVVAVTPFTIRYEKPFEHFSWIDEEETPYLHFKAVQNLPKIQGKPPFLIKQEVPCE